MSQGDQVTNPNTNSNPLWQQLANMNTNYPTSIVPQQQMSALGPGTNFRSNLNSIPGASGGGKQSAMNPGSGSSFGMQGGQSGFGNMMQNMGASMGMNRNFGSMNQSGQQQQPMAGQMGPGYGNMNNPYNQGYGMGSMLGSMYRQPQQGQISGLGQISQAQPQQVPQQPQQSFSPQQNNPQQS